MKSKGSTVCMIGGAGNFPSKMARTKSMPAIEAMTCVGVTPYSTLAVVRSSIANFLFGHVMIMTIILSGLLERQYGTKIFDVMAGLVPAMTSEFDWKGVKTWM